APSMEGTDEPAKSHVVVQRLEAAPGFSSRGNVNQGEQNSGNQLQKEHNERGAAEYVPPACRVSRNGMFRGLTYGNSDLQAVLEPFSDQPDHAHDGFLVERDASGPGVGSSPAWIVI